MKDGPDSHEYLRLRDGVCHYRRDGPDDGDLILLIHGATVPAWEFDRLVPLLTAAGFRTLRADLYGHGYSDRPRLRYDQALFVRQLTELLDALGVPGPVHLLGHSLGAAIGARLALQEPARYDRLALAAPLLDFTGTRRLTRLLELPLVGECLVPLCVIPLLIRRRTRRYRSIEDGRFVALFQRQLAKPGFGRALLSLLRSGALGDQRDAYRALATGDHPLLLLRGADDLIVSDAQLRALASLAPRALCREIDNAAHAFMLTDPERVAPVLIEFFRGTDGQVADASTPAPGGLRWPVSRQ